MIRLVSLGFGSHLFLRTFGSFLWSRVRLLVVGRCLGLDWLGCGVVGWTCLMLLLVFLFCLCS